MHLQLEPGRLLRRRGERNAVRRRSRVFLRPGLLLLLLRLPLLLRVLSAP
jgi:hypothetical protein